MVPGQSQDSLLKQMVDKTKQVEKDLDITAKANSGWYGYILLATYAASQVFSTYFMSQAMDKLQRRLMMILPLVFITVIANFPIGLVIYWVTTNLWTVGQGIVAEKMCGYPK